MPNIYPRDGFFNLIDSYSLLPDRIIEQQQLFLLLGIYQIAFKYGMNEGLNGGGCETGGGGGGGVGGAGAGALPKIANH